VESFGHQFQIGAAMEARLEQHHKWDWIPKIATENATTRAMQQ
jgi:hypothetical protein